jgi:hypothetical protein
MLPDDIAGGACALRVELFSCHVSHYPSLRRRDVPVTIRDLSP